MANAAYAYVGNRDHLSTTDTESNKLHDQQTFNFALQIHLWKSELEFRARHLPDGSCVDWLAPDCNSVDRIAARLRELGFKVRRIVNEEPWPGEVHRWVETTGSINVFVNTENLKGFVTSSAAFTGL